MRSQAKTVSKYLNGLPEDRREAIARVRKTILENLPEGYQEMMQYGMISYVVPLSRYPAGYLGKKDVPLPFVSLASQKNHMAVYLMNIYGDPKAESWFKKAYLESGKRLDMGKSCVRFKKISDIPLDVLGQAVGRTPIDKMIAMYEKARRV